MPNVQMQVTTTGQTYTISVKPWRALVNTRNILQWSCTHNGTPIVTEIMLFSPSHFQGGQPKPGKNPKTGPILSSVPAGKPYRYRIRVEVVTGKGQQSTIVIDPEYERRGP